MLESGMGEFAPLQKRFRAYQHYKDSCVEWLGKIPAHWEIMPLKRLCARSALYGANEPADTYIDKGVRFLRTTDISDQGDLVGNGVYLSAEALSDYLLQTGDLLFSRSGTVGRSFLYNQEKHGPCAYAGYLVRFVPGPEFLPLFGFYLTKSLHFEHWAATVVISSTIGNVNAYKYANMPCPKPPLTEQIEISRFLDCETAKIDALIEKKERLIELLQEKRTALITQAVTKGLDPNVPMKDSGVEWLGEIPAHWGTTFLDKLVNPVRRITYGIVQPGEPDPEGLFMVRGQNYSCGWSRPEEIFRVSAKIEAPYRRARLKKDDIVMTIVGAGTGNVAVVPDWLDGANLTQTTARIALDSKIATNQYFAYQLQSAVGTVSVELTVKGAAQPGLNLGHIAKYRVVVPPLNEQRAIAYFLDLETSKVDMLIEHVDYAIARLNEYRTALVSAAVMGMIDVRDERGCPQLSR